MKSARAVTPRAAYVLANYSLTKTADGWRAASMFEGLLWSEITGPKREDVVAMALCRWGHFNYSDEAQAFNSIFTGPHGNAYAGTTARHFEGGR